MPGESPAPGSQSVKELSLNQHRRPSRAAAVVYRGKILFTSGATGGGVRPDGEHILDHVFGVNVIPGGIIKNERI